ncbi:MAG: hypothetical protein A2161_18955 [Candidatus Schekmanbacteria bacterium RBG_13_48_7]|uniref:Peptidase M1 membrane alanine aminopeptidase domain-containing protein n=1 Tax=Candidatus Schekmanbacteria bacterium RBG_13_48_7 TaxID=1817878 RepID=A0A1F7RW49_9BACT|nr:MAG: hypothetical protein A2161_18955 [Candidatus Schekmanbacteria bacterium RBG_13_48_7]
MSFRKLVFCISLLFIFSFFSYGTLWCQEKIESKYANLLQEEDKDSLTIYLKDLKEKLESDKSGYTLQSFMDEGDTQIESAMYQSIFSAYSIDVVEKRAEKPDKIRVHVPEIAYMENGQIVTYLMLTLEYSDFSISENWKLNTDKTDGRWKIKNKVLTQLSEPLFKPTTRKSDVYRFQHFKFNDDQITLEFENGYIAPIFARNKKIGMVITGNGKITFDPPDLTETYQLKRFTKKSRMEEPVGEVKLTLSPERFDAVFEGLQLESTQDSSIQEKLQNIHEDRLSFFKLTDKYIEIPKKPETVILEFLTEPYGWLCYEFDPDEIKEVALFREKKYSISTYRDMEVWCQYHSATDRQTKSPLQLELEQKIDLDILKMESNVTIDKKNGMDCSSVISYAALYNDLSSTKFTFSSSMKIKSIRDHQNRNLLFYKDGGTVMVCFADTPPRKKIQTLTVEYSADNFTEQMTQGTYYVNLSWYPSWRFFDQYYFDFTIRVPKPYIALSNGYSDRQWEDEEYNVSHWTSSQKIAFPVIMYGRYVVKKDLADGIPIYLYATQDNMTHMQPILEQAREAVRFYNRLFGRYPYEQLSLVESLFHGFGAQAPTTIIYVGSVNFMSLAERASYFITTIQGRGTVSHEVSHQWWGSMVRPISDYEYWWVESLAQFSESLFLQAAGGNDAFKSELFQWKSIGESADKAGPLQFGYRFGSEDGQGLIYYKGPYVFQMLRMMFGSDMMANYLKNIVAAFHDQGAISTRILEMLAEKTFGTKLDWFFDEWVRGNGIPTYYWDYKISPKGNKFKVEVTVNQKVFAGKDELKGVFFKMPVPLRIYFDGGDGVDRNLNITKDKQQFTFIVPEKPKKVTLNEYEAVFCKIEKL